MKLVALCALAAGLALAAVGCGAARDPVSASAVSPVGAAPRTFGPGGGIASGPGSGLWGDTVSGPNGNHLGCISGRHYAQAVALKNTTMHAVTVTGATGMADVAPQIITLVATQVHVAPPQPKDSRLIGVSLRHWSDAPTRPATVPAGYSAIVQRNYLMARCTKLAGGRTLTVPGELRVTYRSGGKSVTQTIDARSSRIILTEGPTKLPCTRVLGGSSEIVAAMTHCSVARKAAVACYPMSHGSWGTCTSDGTLWDCGRMGSRKGWALTETCYLPHEKSHWFRVSWKHTA